MNDDLKEKLRALRLPRLADHWDDDLQEAARQRMSHATLLSHVFNMKECVTLRGKLSADP